MCLSLTHSLTRSHHEQEIVLGGGVESQEAWPMLLDVSVQVPEKIVELVQRNFLCTHRLGFEGAQVQSGLVTVMGDIQEIGLPLARGRHRLPEMVCTTVSKLERSVLL